MPEEWSLREACALPLVTCFPAGPVSRVQSPVTTGKSLPGRAAVPRAEIPGPKFQNPLLLTPPRRDICSPGKLLPVSSGEPGSSHLSDPPSPAGTQSTGGCHDP